MILCVFYLVSLQEVAIKNKLFGNPNCNKYVIMTASITGSWSIGTNVKMDQSYPFVTSFLVVGGGGSGGGPI